MGEAIMLRSGGGGAEKQPTSWRFLQAISANANFTMEKGKWYRVHVYGKSGDGGTTAYTGIQNDQCTAGAGGGGSGGYGCSILMEKRGATVPCTVTASITSFGSYLSAAAGANGGSVSVAAATSSGAGGGAGGSASGGNQANINGFPGGAGGSVTLINHKYQGTAGAGGGNNGGAGGASGDSNPGANYNVVRSTGGGGGGGAHLPNSPYTGVMGGIGVGGLGSKSVKQYEDNADRDIGYSGTSGNTPPVWSATSPPTLYGGGGGAGGTLRGNNHAAGRYGGTGTPGLIIIEVAA